MPAPHHPLEHQCIGDLDAVASVSYTHLDVYKRQGLTGLQWLTLSDALAQHAPFVATLRACAAVPNELRPQLRLLLHYHCGVSSLRTRQMMVDLQKL